MLDFKKINIDDFEILKKYLNDNNEFSCETSFINLILWQSAYDNCFAVTDNQMIIKSGEGDNEFFRLPFGDDFQKGIELIKEYTGCNYPKFWAQDGNRFNEFKEFCGEHYNFIENRDAFDYIYNYDNLALLSGKKYHSKRNHISSFTKQHVWHYESITPDNIKYIKECADNWYKENAGRIDKYMLTERKGIEILLSNMKLLGVIGGAVFVDGKAVAFTLGAAINNYVFDIHIEKALSDYAEGYTVINNEFAKNELSGYKYINREDDLGLEGLRKAKLSYKPEILLKKYWCVPR